MDFALLDKPLCYYQFDYQEFRKRHLEEGYFEYETDGFGPVCKTETDVFRYIEDEISGSNAESRKYQLRREKFFTLKDQNNCMRTYEAIQALR